MSLHFHDSLNYARKLTALRVLNASQNLISYLKSKYTKASHHPALPISIAIEPTTACNLRCPECPSGLRSFTRPTGTLNVALFQKIIDELKDTLTYLTFYFQGEPFLHKSFLDMVAYAHKNGIYTATSTNGHFLSPSVSEATVRSGLDRMIISIDGTSQSTYESYRVDGKLDTVIEGTKNIIAAKKRLQSHTPHVIFQFLVVKPNEHQIDEVYALAKRLGVDEVKLKTAQIYDYQNGNPLIPSQDKYSRFAANGDGTYRIKNQLLDHCWKMWHSCVITWDGQVVPCCFDKDAHHAMGGLQEQSFRDIWNSKPYQAFRKTLFHSRSNIEMCKNCTEGTKVWA